MILELLIDEIKNIFPGDDPDKVNTLSNTTYVIHCSGIFSRAIYKAFIDMGFKIPSTFEDVSKAQFIMYQVPNIGYLKIITDLAQGYKIEKL